MSEWLAIAADKTARRQLRQTGEQLLDQGQERFVSIIASGQYGDRKRHAAQILLVLKVLIGGDKKIKAPSSKFKQLAVLAPGPTRFCHGDNLVAWKCGSQAAG